ncbi:MAG TPA: OmpA family protein [Saprospiraceae bacterium]|nr:OmpA family protein [Saprospiraceae bacterium]
MKNNNYVNILKSVVLCTFTWIAMHSSLEAQAVQYASPSWRFGAAVGANVNFYRGSTQRLDDNFAAPVAFHEGEGAGLYLAPLIEYHNPESIWGFGLQTGYDSRRSAYHQVITPCNCPADLSTNLSYITVEPVLRLAPFKTGFYLYGGPRLAFNLEKSYTYQLGLNPDFPEQLASPEIKGELSHINNTLLSFQIGAGYDILLSAPSQRYKTLLSPFISFHPYIGQSPRSIETWNISTLRIGAALKFGAGRRISSPATTELIWPIKSPEVQFSVVSPKNITTDRRVRETFPLRNYVFFDLGSTKIPGRYVMLRKEQVPDFKESQLEVFAPKNLSGRSRRGMIVYYNVLNILGDRMGKNPSSSITLVGSSEKGLEDGREMAESVKRYLVEIFGIASSRISIEGRDKPKIPSEKPGSTQDIELLREGDRRVSIESRSPALLMEFQSGPNASLMPVEINETQEAPLDSYVVIHAKGAEVAFSSWVLETMDEAGRIQKFGPYTKDEVRLPGKSILGARSAGDYKMTMIGQTKSGKTIRKSTNSHMVLWTPSENEQGMRYSVIYEFDESKAINIYEKYLTDIVTPKIPPGALVIIHGYTDIIGDAAYNQKLSLARANDVKSILANSLSKVGRSDVLIEVYGFGEDETLSPFNNDYPEERFYNRTVLIDIIPNK